MGKFSHLKRKIFYAINLFLVNTILMFLRLQLTLNKS